MNDLQAAAATSEYAGPNKHLTDAQRRYIELDKRYCDEFKAFLDEYKAAKEAAAAETGIGKHFQDDEGVVYLAVVPSGRFQYYEHIGFQRTRREGEAKGDLSMTSAREFGYVVEGK